MAKPTIRQCIIRQADSGDLIQCLRVQSDALRSVGRDDYTSEQIEALIDRDIFYAGRGQQRDAIQFVAQVGGTVVGFSSLLGHHMNALYVHPQWSRQGIGSCLLRTSEKIAAIRKIQTLRVHALVTTQPFWLRRGYGTVKESNWPLRPNLYLRCVMMKKTL